MNNTTIQLDKEIVESLKKVKKYPRQTYNDVIRDMIEVYKAAKYDEFLHKIQQHKMKELWDNPEDEEWENA
jgi:predicted CopG family antitoxin